MKKLLFNEYETKISTACLISSFSNLFFNYNTLIKESDIFFLGNGLELTIDWNVKKSLNEIVLFHDANLMIQNFFNALSEEISIISIPEHNNLERYENFIKLQIDNKKPVILAIHTKYIPYYVVPPKTYRPHFLTVIGYENDQAIVSDCLVPGVKDYATYLGPISFKDLYKASSVRKYIYYEFDLKSIVGKLKNNIFDVIHKNFINSLKEFSNTEIEKLMILAKRIGALSDFYTINEIQSEAENIFFSIKYNGIYYSRILILEHFCQYYLTEKHEDRKIIENLHTIIQRWETINYSLLKNNSFSCKKEKYLQIEKKLMELYELEKKTYLSILNKIM